MNVSDQPTTREEIMRAFEGLLKKHEIQREHVSTMAQDAQRMEDREIVERASTYSVEAIVKGLAELQLGFGDQVDALSSMLIQETRKLEELQRSITVEEDRLEELADIRVAAEALQLLDRDQTDDMSVFESSCTEREEALAKEQSDTRAAWERGQEEFERDVAAHDAKLAKDRAQEEADHAYELTRKRKIAADDFEQKKLNVEQELTELENELVKNWTKRDLALEEKADEIAQMRQKAQDFPQLMEDAVKKSRDTAIRKASDAAKVQAELVERGFTADLEVYQLQIESLEQLIAQQTQEISELQSELADAASQTQGLALRAIEGSSGTRSSAQHAPEA